MTSVRDQLAQAAHALRTDEARREATLLLRHVLGVSEAWLIAHGDDALAPAHAIEFAKLIERRARGEPVAYLTGTRGFHDLELEVSPDVLIPRPETGLLVELALQRIPTDAPRAVADLGTGSGALALAIARARPHVRVLATDASEAALAVARRNAGRLELRNVTFIAGDWCAPLRDSRFDLIVSNPPYIAEGDPHLREGDLRFEPRTALASGHDGLDAIRIIIRDARAHLHEGGWLLVEHGFEQGASVRELLASHGYAQVFTECDVESRERISGARVGDTDQIFHSNRTDVTSLSPGSIYSARTNGSP